MNFNKTKAEDSLKSTNIIAVLVDQNIYNDLSTEIKRYTTQYIQKEVSNSKAVVLPINTKNFKAQDITKILENMYFDGLKEETSKLVGLILLGDIPLPVIKNQGFIYPSIYPYTDFENQKFIRNEQEKYFVYNNNPKGEAELWHSIINYKDNINEYKTFFKKLKNYYTNPSDFVDTKLWYDDMIANKKYFYQEALGSYINNFIYSEDIGYHRFTNLLLKMVQGEQNEEISSLLSGYQGNFKDDNNQTLNGYNVQDSIDDLNEIKAPTKMLQKMLKESFLKEYDALLSPKQLARMRDNVQSAGRWIQNYTGEDGSQATRTSFDSHYQKIMQKDDVILRYNAKLYPTLIEFNNTLEKSIDKQIEDQKYYMQTPLLVSYQAKQDHKKKIIPFVSWCVKDWNDTYINYYFGKSSEDIDNIEDTSIYRGTFRNLSSIQGLTTGDIQNSNNPATDINTDLSLKSIGASYDLFSTQVQGNRGFNIFNSPAEFEFWSGAKTNKERSYHCTKSILGILCIKKERAGEGDCNLADPEEQADCENPQEFAQRNRGGASALNLNTEKLQNGIYEINNFTPGSTWFPIYDIAGSYGIKTGEQEANSYLGLSKYGSLTRVQNKYGLERESIRHVPTAGKSFFEIYNPIYNFSSAGKYFYIQIGQEKDCGNDWQKYGYKLIDTRYKNTTIKSDQVDGYDYDRFSDKYYLKKYYDYIKTDIDSTYNKIDQNRSEFSGDSNISTGVTNNISQINTLVNQVITGLDQIINFNLNNIGNQTLISSGRINITNEAKLQIQEKGSNALSGLLKFDNFLSAISTENIEYYINALKYNAQINKEQVQFLSGRQHYLNAKFTLTKNLFTNLKTEYNNTRNLYYSINTGDLLDKITLLQGKRTAINNLQLCGTSSCGCTNNYATLCTTINQTILNINTIKNSIKEISELQEYDGTTLNDINVILGIDQNYSGNSFNSDLTTSLNIINGFQTINDTSNIPKIHFPGMNITTQDRPIDSPRYVTFQGLSGNVVKMIYPDLYKVEVYSRSGDILTLKNTQEIENAIKAYLIKVVQKYNQILQDQLNHKTNFYNTKANAFNRLQSINPLASPNRSYQLFDEQYLIDTIGNDNIATIAQILYYHNITNQQIKIGATIQEDIQNKIDTFDINQKISNVMSNYLVQDNEQGPLITPSYNSKGYEVGFLNSDGEDYINDKPLPNFIQQIQESKSRFTQNNVNNQIPQEKSEFEEQLNTECGINADGTALLFDLSDFSSPWLKAFKCRLKKTLQKPFEMNVTFPNSFDLEGFSMIKELDEQQQTFGSQRSALNPDEFNQSAIANTTSDTDAIKLQEMLSYIQTKSDKTSLNISNNTGALEILSTKDLGNVKINIYSTGDDCLSSPGNSNNLCSNQISKTINPYTDKQKIPIKIKDNKAGSTIITFEMCLPNTDSCVKKTQQINILPGEIQQLKLITPDEKIMAGAQLPILVQGLDQYQNNVGQILKNFFISVSTGEIGNGESRGQSIRFNNFNQSSFIYYAPTNSSGAEQVSINISGENTSLSASKNLNIIKGIPKANYQTSTVYQIIGNNIYSGVVKFALPGDVNYYHFNDNFGVKQINQSKLPQISLEILSTNGNKIPITSFANIKTKNNLIKVGNIQARTRTIKTGGNTFEIQQMGFYAQNTINIQSGKTIIYMYPNFKAGNDTLLIDIPGIKTIEIPIQIKTGPAKIITLKIDKTSLGTEKSTPGSLQISDVRGNLFTDAINIKIGTIGSIALSGANNNPKLLTVVGGTHHFEISTKQPGGIAYIFSNIDGISLNDQNPGYETIVVQKSIIPTEKLNIMYLNLFGTDRGNQRGYFSDNKDFVQQLMTGSEKLIATTTSLIDPYKLKKIDYIIDTNGQIQNPNSIQSTLSSTKFKRQIQIDGIGELSFDNKNFNIIQVDQDEEGIYDSMQISLQEMTNKNTFYYIPEALDDGVKENTVIQNNIIVNSKSVFDTLGNIDSKISIKLSDKYIQGLNTREIYLEDKLIGTLLINIGETPIVESNIVKASIKISNPEYQNTIVFSEGSTNGKQGIGFYTQDSNFPEDSKGYNSIEDSKDPTLNIGFKGDLKNITLFAGGENIGESTKHFASEFLINYGDPLVKRLNKNPNVNLTNYDGGLGKILYSDPDKTIFKVKNIDFNNDGLQDFAVTYTDGTIKLLKNYGGDTPYHNLQELAILADGIKEIYIGDVDGNSYDDIIILTKGDQLRVYINQFGIFDVDGYLACLNTNVKQGYKSKDPSDLSGIDQLFLQDMNKDNKIDIITNDKKGYIKIFYGGNNNTKGYANYISKLKYSCDPDRYTRQSTNQNTKIVKRFGIKLDETKKILDNSLLHWKGLKQPSPEEQYQTKEDLENAGINVNTDQINNYLEDTDPENIDQDALVNMAGPNNFDVNKIIGAGAENYLKYVSDPVGLQPIYETLTGENLVFMPLGFLSGEDPIQAYKNYEDLNGDILEDGDLVKVSVTLKANKNFLGTFIDKISGPRSITMHPNGNIKHFWFKTGTDISNIKMHRKLENGYSYMLDNLEIAKGEYIQFYYRINYIAGDNVKIDIKDIQGQDYKYKDSNPLSQYIKDSYPDISTNPTDGCSKSMTVFFNNHTNNGKDYDEKFVDLQRIMQEYTQEQETKYDDTMSQISNMIGNANSEEGISSLIGSNTFENFDVGELLSQSLNGGSTINLGFLDEATAGINDKIDGALNGLCQGFKLGGNSCGGLPIPFNQAFLAPGKYHLFGCYNLPLTPLDKGLPILSFPTTSIIPIWPPSPPGAGGIFGGVSSQFRLYIAPTLTMQMGIAMCMGPYTLGANIPKPFRDIGGNCVVVAIPLPLPCGKKSNSTTTTDQYPERMNEIGSNANSCNSSIGPSAISNGYAPSPFQLVGSSENSPNSTPVIPQNSYAFGFIQIDKDPVSVEQETQAPEVTIGGVKLQKGANIKNQIKGGMTKGLKKIIIDNWLDKQIKYIMNNLTQMDITVYLPEMDDLFKGSESIQEKIEDSTGSKIKLKQKNETPAIKKLIQNKGVQKSELKNLSNTFSNPFDQIAVLFKDMKLIKINQKNINIKVPMIYSEDINAYSSYLKQRKITNFGEKNQNGELIKEGIIHKRKNLIYGAIGMCALDQNKVAQKQGLKEKYQEVKKQLDEAKAELEKELKQTQSSIKTTLTGNTTNITGLQNQLSGIANTLTGIKVEKCLDVFGENKFKKIIDGFVSMETNSAELENAIRENLNTLELYKKFPLQLYEWIHIQDKYVGEVSSLLTNFIGKITYRINTNASRYSQYVNSLVTLIGIIKTYQVLIDFSVNRSERCGKCSNDTYDSYSCSLSMLCPDVGLPILAIPSFKIPNIIIDLSNINLGIDILLPKFNFTPTKVALVKIPNLPEPPKYSANMSIEDQLKIGLDLVGSISASLSFIQDVNIPSIPELPKPPQLPQPPTLLPTINMDLPVLPPAPKLPEISTSIKSTLKTAEIIGKILCIVKGGIGLVGEKGVKAKIEQLTQRTYDVPFFDFMDLTTKFKNTPLKGFDYEIDSFVNLQFNFNGVYSIFEGIADQINKYSQGFENVTEKTVGQISNELNNNSITESFGNIQGGGNVNIQVGSGKILNYNPQSEYNLIDHQEAKQGLIQGLNYFQKISSDTQTNNKIKNILDDLQDTKVQGQIDELENINKQAQEIITKTRKENIKIAQNIKSDYDGFIKILEKNPTKLVSNDEINVEFSTDFFKIPDQTKKLLLAQENPIKTYTDTQSKIVKGYLKALNTNDAKTLNMNQLSYTNSINYLSNLDKKIQIVSNQINKNQISKPDYIPNIKTQNTATKPLISQSNGGTNTSSTSVGGYTDISSFINGVLVQGYSGTEKRMVNTVYDNEFVSNIKKNYYQKDINKDNKEDLIMRDAHSIYTKYYKQEDKYLNTKTYSDYYAYNNGLVQAQDLQEITNQGYLQIGDISIKIYSNDFEVKNFRIGGQTFETISFSRLNSKFMGNDPDGYLIKINQRVDTFNDKDQIIDSYNEDKINKKYILVLPIGFDYTGTKIRLEEGTYRTEKLLTGTINQIVYFNPANETINAVLNDLPRNREYTKIATLKSENNILFINSPRSNQTVGGVQILGDNKGPEATVTLYRPQIQKTIGTGDDLKGFIGTHYILNALREDNVAVSKMRIEKDGEIIQTLSGLNKTGFINITGLFFTGETQEKYIFRAEDFNNNIEKQDVILDIQTPKLEITKIQKLTDPIGSIINPITISTQMESDIDEGNIIFQRSRYKNLRQNLTGTLLNGNEISRYPVTPEKTVITGGYFDFGETIGLYLSDGNQVASVDPSNGKIELLTKYKTQMKVTLDFSSHIPIIKIIDIIQNKVVFQLYFPAESLINLYTNGYEKFKLENQSFGVFKDGWAIQDNKETILYVSPAGHIYTDQEIYGEYTFNDNNKTIVYKFWTKDKENNKGSIEVKIKPLFQ